MGLHVLLPLGLFAGILTTIAGLGGGILLTVCLSLALGPKAALVVTGPALLLGNAHRVWLLRRHVDGAVAQRFAGAALLGSALGGFLLPRVPDRAVALAMSATTALAVLRALGWVSLRPSPRTLVPLGFGVGALSATAGGAGVLAGPILSASGLRGAAYVGTAAVGAVAMHLGRVVSYGTSGLFDGRSLRAAAALVVALLLGNVVGARLRGRVSPTAGERLELGTLVVAAAATWFLAGR